MVRQVSYGFLLLPLLLLLLLYSHASASRSSRKPNALPEGLMPCGYSLALKTLSPHGFLTT
jgi:hypothetical protein